ncbi:MAG: HD domain-containing protein [Patescibacteria group bacterium]|jgi:hypothetical protein
MQLPTVKECQELYRFYHTPSNVQAHMLMVERVAVWLAQQRQICGDPVNVPLVSAAAKLHDLVRIKDQWQYLPGDIKTPLQHEEINYLVLNKQYPAVAAIIRTHGLMTILKDGFANLEQKIVYYADKRVDHHTIVSLAERLRLGQQRWQIPPEQDCAAALLKHITNLEQTLFKGLAVQPNQLREHVSNQIRL